MVDVLVVVRDDGTATARMLAGALRALVERRLPGVPGLVCAWGPVEPHERAYRDRVIEIELREDRTQGAPAPPTGRVWRCGGAGGAGPLERIFDALVADLRGCGLLSHGA
jgi:hypothetical protein